MFSKLKTSDSNNPLLIKTTFRPSLSYSKYFDALWVNQNIATKKTLTMTNVQLEFSKKIENVLNNVTHNMMHITIIKYTDIMTLLTSALFVRILQ